MGRGRLDQRDPREIEAPLGLRAQKGIEGKRAMRALQDRKALQGLKASWAQQERKDFQGILW